MRLPLNCKVDYLHAFLSTQEADELYRVLMDTYHIHQSQLIVEAGGKRITTDSFKILFATERLIQANSHPENIHGKTFVWSGPMAKLREKIETLLNTEFELAMCLFYPDGNYFAPYHSDQQTSGYKTILPSLSLGEVRPFGFKENDTQHVHSLDLANGSLLIMGDYCQNRYTHSLPKTSRYKKGRINITFRDPSFK